MCRQSDGVWTVGKVRLGRVWIRHPTTLYSSCKKLKGQSSAAQCTVYIHCTVPYVEWTSQDVVTLCDNHIELFATLIHGKATFYIAINVYYIMH